MQTATATGGPETALAHCRFAAVCRVMSFFCYWFVGARATKLIAWVDDELPAWLGRESTGGVYLHEGKKKKTVMPRVGTS